MKKKALLLPMKLQFFADPSAGSDPPPSNPQPSGAGGTSAAGTEGQSATGQGLPFDYEKLASIIQGKQTVAEDTVLKNYFQQQGLSKEEMAQAIAAFKQQKAASQPDIAAIQAQSAQAQAAASQARIEAAATMAAVGLGLDAKTIPYVLKMADLSRVVGQDGKLNEDTLKAALNKVLEDVPALKPQATGTTGFVQVGTGGNSVQQNQGANSPTGNQTVPSKRWNRFNN